MCDRGQKRATHRVKRSGQWRVGSKRCEIIPIAQFVMFELSTQRSRLDPGRVMTFFYEDGGDDSEQVPIIVDVSDGHEGVELTIWRKLGGDEDPVTIDGEEAYPA